MSDFIEFRCIPRGRLTKDVDWYGLAEIMDRIDVIEDDLFDELRLSVSNTDKEEILDAHFGVLGIRGVVLNQLVFKGALRLHKIGEEAVADGEKIRKALSAVSTEINDKIDSEMSKEPSALKKEVNV